MVWVSVSQSNHLLHPLTVSNDCLQPQHSIVFTLLCKMLVCMVSALHRYFGAAILLLLAGVSIIPTPLFISLRVETAPLCAIQFTSTTNCNLQNDYTHAIQRLFNTVSAKTEHFNPRDRRFIARLLY